jgi:hypothetical protein
MTSEGKIYIVWEREYNPVIDTIWYRKQDAERRKNGIIQRHRMNGVDCSDAYARVECKDVL